MEESTIVSSSTVTDVVGIIVELVSGSDETSPALVHETGRALIASLQCEGYNLRQVYTGTRGDPFIVEVVNAVTQAASFIWANRTTIEEVLNDTSALVTIMGGTIPLFKHIVAAHKSQIGPAKASEYPLKVIITINGASIEVEGQDVAQVDAALALAHKYTSAHPQMERQVLAKSKVRVQAQLPGQPRRRRK